MPRYEGHVDAVTPFGVYGWIVDGECPAEPAWVTCRGRNGAAVKFRAHVAREDVQKALALTGTFGFALPLAALRTLESPVTFCDAEGGVVRGGADLDLTPLEVDADPDRPVTVVLHIPKTAGTSLRVAMTSSFDDTQVALVYPDPGVGLRIDEFVGLPFEQRRALKLVIGHLSFGAADGLPALVDYVTFLRRPEPRLRSHFRHHLAGATTWNVDGERLGVREVAERGLSDEFDNVMTRRLSGVGLEDVPLGAVGSEHLEQALDHLRTRFRFIGLQERMATHYGALCDLLSLPAWSLGTENTRAILDSALVEASVDWDLVLSNNRFDAMLYDAVLAEGLAGRDLARAT